MENHVYKNILEIIADYKKAKTENLIVNLQGDNHKNVTWSFRYVTPSNDAVTTAEGIAIVAVAVDGEEAVKVIVK